MAAIEFNRPTYEGFGFSNRLTAAISATFGAFSSWNDLRATRSALGKLSDRDLEDIGLCRGDVERLTY